MRQVLTVCAAATLMLAAACNTAPAPPSVSLIVGSGATRIETRAVSGFTQIAVYGPGEVNLRQDGTEALTIEAEDNVLPLLSSDVRAGRLVLGTERGIVIRPTQPIRYTLNARQVTGLEMNGGGFIRASDLHTDVLRVTVNGGTRVRLDGSVDRQDIVIAGASDYQADQLVSREANVEINGAGTVVLNVSTHLTATINGAGTVEYIGSPRVERSINGLGTVRPRS
jgi:hypothetical protein